VIFPLEQTILLVVPAVGVCALLAWHGGGRAWLALTMVALSAWMLARPSGGGGSYDLLARGWAILVASLFGVLSLVGERRSFLNRALPTVALAFALSATVILVSNVSPARVKRTLSDELDRRVAASAAAWMATAESPAWQRFSADHPTLSRLMADSERQWRQLPAATLALFPALLALESLAAMALSWALFHRISRSRIGPPLAPLRDFRFGDQLVWGLLVGVAILVIPSLSGLRSLGLNLVVFFGALYALRGLGVLTWFLRARRLAVALLIVLSVVFWPFVGILSLGVGLGDTWIDWRGRMRQAT
jgi:hypothetical protein